MCKIEVILLSKNLEKILFVRNLILLFYNEMTGLLEEIALSDTSNICCCDFENIICIEPLLSLTTPNAIFYYFKSAPFENL